MLVSTAIQNSLQIGKRCASAAWTFTKKFSVFYTIKTYLLHAELYVLEGDSMKPTLCGGDVVIGETHSVHERRLVK
jgi:signal peptidase I